MSDINQRIHQAMADAHMHQAYLFALHKLGVSEEDARAMAVAYIQSIGVAGIKLEIPPEPPIGGEGWKG